MALDTTERIDSFRGSSECPAVGEQLRLVREEAPRFRDAFSATGMPEYVESFDLALVPYPTEFGFFRVKSRAAPLLTFTNRLLVVRWRDASGGRKTLLWEPSDVALGRNTPFFAALSERTPGFLQGLGFKHFADPVDHLGRIGIDPGEVDYLAFDHLHTQDCRRLVGTNGPAADLSPSGPVAPLFPRAKLIVQRAEWELVRSMHPWQARWYQAGTYSDLRDGAVQLIEGDVLLGPGVALLSTPGHSSGMMSLALRTSTGIWASSENVIAVEMLTPEHSKIPGVRKSAAEWGVEVVLNGNTIEHTAQQYNSVIKEKSVVDRSAVDDRFLQFFPTSELTRNALMFGTSPTFSVGHLLHGKLVRES
ncbi:MAG: hypothetical protein ACRENE_20215 [Polyangiaceae bacterium]